MRELFRLAIIKLQSAFGTYPEVSGCIFVNGPNVVVSQRGVVGTVILKNAKAIAVVQSIKELTPKLNCPTCGLLSTAREAK